MKIITVLTTVAVADQYFLNVDRQCNPKTKVKTCNTKDDITNNCVWVESQGIDKQQVDMSGHQDKQVAMICGPGKFQFAPFKCGHEGADPSRHDYKAETFECTTKEDCDCREVKLKHFANCYSVTC